MILRLLMRNRPKYDIYEVIGRYFTKSSVDLKEEIYSYIDERVKKVDCYYGDPIILVSGESFSC